MRPSSLIVSIVVISTLNQVQGLEYLISLNPQESFQGFMDSSINKGRSVKEFLGAKIGRTFLIGSFKGLTVELSSREVLENIRKNPMVAEVVPNFVVKAFEENDNEYGDYSNYKDYDIHYKKNRYHVRHEEYYPNEQYDEDYDDEETFPLIAKKQSGAPRHLARVSRRMQLPYDFEDMDVYKGAFNYYYDKWNQGSSVRAYILDSGIYKEHCDFRGRVEFGHDFTGEGSGDGNGHGTHVAGIVGSKTFGVAKNVTIVDVKCLDANGHGSLVTVLSAIEYAVNDCHKYPHKKCVANLSLGAIKNTVINKAVRAATKNGVVVVVAAGNFNMNACWNSPASAHEAITVGAFDDRIDTIAKFSNWGPCVDIFAPGVGVASLSNIPNSKYVAYSGTSMAAPSVCGVVCLLLDKGISSNKIKSKLIKMATDDVFQKRTLLFKPSTPNRVLFGGIDKDDDQYDDFSFPEVDLDILIEELQSYSPSDSENINKSNENELNDYLNLNNDVSLPLKNLQLKKRII